MSLLFCHWSQPEEANGLLRNEVGQEQMKPLEVPRKLIGDGRTCSLKQEGGQKWEEHSRFSLPLPSFLLIPSNSPVPL